jgi:hypothetical protein
MIPLPLGLVAKAGAIVAVVAVIWFGSRMVESRINDYIETKEALTEARINEARQQALIEYQQRLAQVEEEYQDKHVALLETTQASITEAREQARMDLSVTQMDRIAQSERGNELLTARAKTATRKLYDEIEALSDWSTVYAR